MVMSTNVTSKAEIKARLEAFLESVVVELQRVNSTKKMDYQSEGNAWVSTFYRRHITLIGWFESVVGSSPDLKSDRNLILNNLEQIKIAIQRFSEAVNRYYGSGNKEYPEEKFWTYDVKQIFKYTNQEAIPTLSRIVKRL